MNRLKRSFNEAKSMLVFLWHDVNFLGKIFLSPLFLFLAMLEFTFTFLFSKNC